MRVVLSIIIILLATIYNSYSQLTVEDNRMQVLESSWTLKGARNSVVQSEQNLAYTRTLQLPKLQAAGTYRYFLRQFSGQEPWALSIEPQIIQTIYGGGVIRSDIKKAELAEQVMTYNERYTELEVRYLADYAYWNYWAMNRHFLVMEQYVAIIAKQCKNIKRRYDEGYTSKGDLLMIESQLSEAKFSLISSNQTRLKALHNLNTLRGVDPADSISIAKMNVVDYPHPSRIPIGQVIEQRPDYSAMLLREKIANAATQSVRGSYNPTLQGGIASGIKSYIPNISGDTYFDASVSLSLSIPIYHFGERRKAVAVSKSTEQQASFNSNELLENIINEESDAWLAVVESFAKVDLAQKSLDIASENLDISTFSYNEGLVSIIDLMQAQISWIQIYTNAINSEYNYLTALAYYTKTVGVK